jgi:hypothetical protein
MVMAAIAGNCAILLGTLTKVDGRAKGTGCLEIA